jgi:hypothetical protein
MFYTILSLLSSLFAALMTLVMLFAFRKPRRISAFSCLSSALISLFIPVVFLLITGSKPDPRLALPFFGLGLLLGYLRGITMKLEFVGDQVVGRHSILFLLLWGFSLALNQALSTLNSTLLMAVGLMALFISTGTQVGFYGMLAARRLVLIPPEADTGKIQNQGLQKVIALGFGGLLLIFLLETLLYSIPALPFSGGGRASRLEPEEMVFESGESAEQMPDGGISSGFEPYFSGEEILIWSRPLAAFLSESEHILYAFRADGTGVRKVYAQPVGAVDSPAPQLSPDGNLWIVTSKRTGEYEQYLMAADGSRTYQLRYQDTPVTIKDWSPDASQILVQVQVNGSWDVLLTDREGADWQAVANLAADETEPRFAPNGQDMLYLSDQDGNQEIYLASLEGGIPINLTQDPGHDKRAAWALNGTRIIFTSDREGFYGLYHMNPDGGDVRLIAQDFECGLKYQLSPDQDHLLYNRDTYYEGDQWEDKREECESSTLTLASLTGGTITTLETSPSSTPKWSPDGGSVLFFGPYDLNSESQELFAIRADGTGLANLTPPNNEMFLISWSSDSERVAQVESYFREGEGTKYVLTVTNGDGSNRHEVAPISLEPDYAFAFEGFSWP